MSMNRDSPIPPFLSHTLDFLHHFSLFFVVPILAVIFSAIVSAALAKWLYRSLFGRYATPDELLEEAVELLKKDGCTVSVSAVHHNGVVGIGGKKSTTTFLGSGTKKSNSGTTTMVGRWMQVLLTNESPSSLNRKRALEDLRLVIQLEPRKIKAYEVLATELFYGEINGVSGEEDVGRNNLDRRQQRKYKQAKSEVTKVLDNPNEGGNDIIDTAAIRRRRPNHNDATSIPRIHPNSPNGQQQNNLSPTLLECQEIISQGLLVDPKNVSLNKLWSELQVIIQYGRSGIHAKMMNVGSFGWMGGS